MITKIREKWMSFLKGLGSIIGEVASGTWDTDAGIVNQNEEKLDAGLNDMGKA